MDDAAIHRVSGTRAGCLFGYWITVDRHARKGLAMTRVDVAEVWFGW